MRRLDELYNEAVLQMSELLIDWGFAPEDALKESRNFWKKHKKKLYQVVP